MSATPSRNRLRVALVEWNWTGHHSAYFASFAEVLCTIGCETLAICPCADEVEAAWLVKSRDTARAPIHFMPFAAPTLNMRPRRWHGMVNAILSFRWIRSALRNWEARNGCKLDLVFFACIYDWDFRYLPRTASGFPWPWSGLYLHCRDFRMPGTPLPYTRMMPCPERIFRHSNLQSVAILDEGADEYMQRLTNGRPVVVFPDLANASAPAPGGVACRMKEFAAGRPLVGAFGHLQPTKGVTALAQVALNPENRHLAFAFVGEVMLGLFSTDDRQLIDQLRSTPNVFAHFERVTDGPAFNALVRNCDIIFAAYTNFPNSSNMLTKAALFEKPVIVSDGYLMAERVRGYALGEVIPEGNVEALNSAIRALCDNTRRTGEKRQPQWERYREAHSSARLAEAFTRLLGSIKREKSNASVSSPGC